MNHKEYILKLINDDIGAAQDNLCRAKMAFQGRNMSDVYGQSGKTCQQIINGYQEWHDRAMAAKEWVILRGMDSERR